MDFPKTQGSSQYPEYLTDAQLEQKSKYRQVGGRDKLNKEDTNMMGGLIQAGFFPHYLVALVPKNLEFAGRYAFVDPNRDVDNDTQQEASGVMTYFINGHSNKLNFQVSHLMLKDPATGASASDQRFWVQWDVSF